jgi:hypothetical protein
MIVLFCSILCFILPIISTSAHIHILHVFNINTDVQFKMLATIGLKNIDFLEDLL